MAVRYIYSRSLWTWTLVLPGCAAKLWAGPSPTPPPDLVAAAGIPPQPTDPPRLKKYSPELRRRSDLQFPPPDNWCGFISSDYDDVISCSADRTCVNSGTVIGCCTTTSGTCSGLWTSCVNRGGSCDADCQLNPAILKCNDDEDPFCAIHSYPGATFQYGCRASSLPVRPVAFLNDYYYTAIGSTVGVDRSDIFAYSDYVSIPPYSTVESETSETESTSSSTSSSSYSSSVGPPIPISTPDQNSQKTEKGGLSTGAIAGIAVAACVIGLAAIAALVLYFLRARKRKRQAEAQNPAYNTGYGLPPMQQQQPTQQYGGLPFPARSYGGYQAVPQGEAPQDSQYQKPQYPYSPNLQSQPQYHPVSEDAPALPQITTTQSPLLSSTQITNPDTSDAATSGRATSSHYQSTSLTTGGVPSMYSTSGSDPRQSHYVPPISPSIQEVDGTLGNPGVPLSSHSDGSANEPREVDGTTSNPGVPVEGSRVPQIQGLPGGSPSSTEIEGKNLNAFAATTPPASNSPPGISTSPKPATTTAAGPTSGSSLTAPWSDSGPFEMGTSDRDR